MKTNPTHYRGHRFPPEIISHGVWLYHRFCLSFRDVEELLAKRGIIVTYETVRQGSTPWRLVADKLKSYGAAHRITMPSVMRTTVNGVVLNLFRFSRHRMA